MTPNPPPVFGRSLSPAGIRSRWFFVAGLPLLAAATFSVFVFRFGPGFEEAMAAIAPKAAVAAWSYFLLVFLLAFSCTAHRGIGWLVGPDRMLFFASIMFALLLVLLFSGPVACLVGCFLAMSGVTAIECLVARPQLASVLPSPASQLDLDNLLRNAR